MKYHERKHIRLKDYDYSQKGIYFVTICSYKRKNIFGDIFVGQGLCSCQLSFVGQLIEKHMIYYNNENFKISKYVIMPNHVHFLIELLRQEQSPCPTIMDIICSLKSKCTKEYNIIIKSNGFKIFQTSFFDRVVRNENEYLKIIEYIENNPIKWTEDKYYN